LTFCNKSAIFVFMRFSFRRFFCPILLSLAFAAILTACVTTPGERQGEFVPDTLGQVEKLINEKPVEGLWRAYLQTEALEAPGIPSAEGDPKIALFDKAAEKVTALYTEAVKKGDTLAAQRYARSLTALKVPGTFSVPAPKAPSAVSAPGTPPRLAETIKGTVTVWLDLGIRVERGRGFADSSLGSGFFIDTRGYLITNYHVISPLVDPKYEGFSRLYIRLSDDPDTNIPAKVIGWDPILDLALLKTEVPPPYVFTLGSSVDLDPGDRIFAIGSPAGLERTLTAGIISAVGRNLFSVVSVMQIDAAVNPGNSGGPIIDDRGRVLGIVFAGALQYEGLNFAIPVEYLEAILPRLYAGGLRLQSWLGAYGRTNKELSEIAPDLPAGATGVEVQYAIPGGAASRVGLKPGDTILRLNGEAVADLEALKFALIGLGADQIVRISGVTAGNAPFDLPIYLAARPQNPGYDVYERDIIAHAFTPIFGMELIPVSNSSRRSYSITRVLKGSIADQSGFSPQDPVDVLKIQVSKEKDALLAQVYTKKRKNGYFDLAITIGAPLDSPNYF
jgi:S1-C subfamily serine protease